MEQKPLADTPARLLLASSSPYRASLLRRLGVPFETRSPDIDETRQPDESVVELVARLATAKAVAIQPGYPKALVIGSDQVATIGDHYLGKPGDRETAEKQLLEMSGHRVDFVTGLCVLNNDTGRRQVDHVTYAVYFRELAKRQIESYLDREQPFNCAASFRSEGLGIVLASYMEGEDPTALIGLPLIRLTSMLAAEGLDVLAWKPESPQRSR